MVCSLHSVTTGSRDRANVSLIIIMPVGIISVDLQSQLLPSSCTSFLSLSHRENIIVVVYFIPVLTVLLY